MQDQENARDNGSTKEVIRNAKLDVIGYRELSGAREILSDKQGNLLGVFERDTRVTRDRFGKIIGFYVNQLMSLL
jgi:hypothetical protein